jgi:hypothetical protein
MREYSKHAVTFWPLGHGDTRLQPELGLIQHPQDICSIVSPDDQFLTIGDGGKATIQSQSTDHCNDAVHTNNFLVPIIFPWHSTLSRLLIHPTFQEPDIQIDDAMLHQVHQNAVIRYWLHHKERSPCRQGERHKAYRACDIAFELPFYLRYLSPFDQGVSHAHRSPQLLILPGLSESSLWPESMTTRYPA